MAAEARGCGEKTGVSVSVSVGVGIGVGEVVGVGAGVIPIRFSSFPFGRFERTYSTGEALQAFMSKPSR